MAEPDNVARVISLLSTVLALASLLIAVLSYRRGRPRVIVKDARVVTAMQNPEGGGGANLDDTLLVQAILVNRGQARVQLASGTRSGAWPLAVEFQRRARRRRRPADQLGRSVARAPLHTSRTRVGHAAEQTLVSPVADSFENDQIDGFSGLAVSGDLPDELLIRAMTAELWKMRVRVTLSSGDVIFSHWFNTPSPWEGLARRRRAGLQQDALAAMNDLATALRESSASQNMTVLHGLASKAGLKAAVVDDLLHGRREPTWPLIAKIVDALSTDFIQVRPRLEHWKAKWGASLGAGRWDNESTDGSG